MNTSTLSSASPNISGRSDHTVKLHASAGIASASARTRSFVVRNATRNRNTATHAPARPTDERIPNAPTDAVERAVHDLGQPRLRDPVRARGRERVRIAVRDAVIEDQLAGAQVPEERVVAERAAHASAKPPTP